MSNPDWHGPGIFGVFLKRAVDRGRGFFLSAELHQRHRPQIRAGFILRIDLQAAVGALQREGHLFCSNRMKPSML